MPWLQLSFDIPRDRAEAHALELELAGALSVTLGDAGDEPQLEPGPGETPLWSEVTLTALFESDDESAELVERIARDLTGRIGAAPRIERLEDQVWERVWLDTFKPTRFGKRLWVCPHGQPADDPDAVVVSLDPGLAFGTGHHPTTALCLEWLDAAELNGKTVLDFGCGSGILAIAALKLGARRAIGVDHDEQALEATRDNALANGVLDRLDIDRPADFGNPSVDCVVANILAGPLVELAPMLTDRLRPGGRLALSGILVEQIETVEAAYRGYIALDPTETRDGWALVTGRKDPDSVT